MRSPARRLSAASLCLGLAACHHAAGPEDVLAAYTRHLRRGEIEAAYALTTTRHRRRRDLAAFAAAVARQPLLEARGIRRAETRVVVELGAPGVMPVTVTADGHDAPRLSSDPLDFYPRGTPEAALASFVRAVERGQHARLLELVAAPIGEKLRADPTQLPESFLGAATEIKARLVPAAGMPIGVLEDGVGGVRLLLGEAAFITLASTPAGWQLTSLP